MFDEAMDAKDLLYLYLIIGGMPRAVQVYMDTNDLNQVAEIHEMIVRLYKQDFTKYEEREKLKLREIYDAMAGELDSKNKRFRINALGTGMSYDRAENAFLNSKKQGELDFVIELDGKVCPIEIEFGKDYKRHRALENVLEDANYEIEKAFIFRIRTHSGMGENVICRFIF